METKERARFPAVLFMIVSACLFSYCVGRETGRVDSDTSYEHQLQDMQRRLVESSGYQRIPNPDDALAGG